MGIDLNKRPPVDGTPAHRSAAIAGNMLMVSLMPLFQLEPGQRARIRQLMGMPDQVHRLEELGLRAGSTVEMVQPGSPCIVRLDGGKLCFRGNEAFSVLVQAGDEE